MRNIIGFVIAIIGLFLLIFSRFYWNDNIIGYVFGFLLIVVGGLVYWFYD
jgi:Co/Zn/Cd efflux system component